jgi:hypothetical protein
MKVICRFKYQKHEITWCWIEKKLFEIKLLDSLKIKPIDSIKNSAKYFQRNVISTWYLFEQIIQVLLSWRNELFNAIMLLEDIERWMKEDNKNLSVY